MVYDSNSENYVKQDSVPIGQYLLNEENSYCINGGTISEYDNTNGTLKYTFSDVDECYAYFEELPVVFSIIQYYDCFGYTEMTNKTYEVEYGITWIEWDVSPYECTSSTQGVKYENVSLTYSIGGDIIQNQQYFEDWSSYYCQ